MKHNDSSSAVLDRIYDTRRENLRALARPPQSATALGAKLGYSTAYMSQLIGSNPTRVVNEKAARGIEGKLGLVNGWLDVAR